MQIHSLLNKVSLIFKIVLYSLVLSLVKFYTIQGC